MLPADPASPRVLVVGCGAVGGVLAGNLAVTSTAPAVLTTNAAIASAVAKDGLVVRGVAGHRIGKAAAVHAALTDAVEPFDVILLATQPPEAEAAARAALPWLRADGQLVCLQNGLCEERLEPLVGRERLVGAVVSWGASMLGPGVYSQTALGSFTLGRYGAEPDGAVQRVAELLRPAFPVIVTRNLRGVRWSKLAVNSAISTLGTVAGTPLGKLLEQRRARRLALELVSEVIRVARTEGVRLEPVADTLELERLELGPARWGPKLAVQHLLVLAVGVRYRRMRSSMLSAIERGRTPAIDFLNGEVVARARKHGIPVPVNTRATELVWQIARGEQAAGMESLTALYESTR